MTISTFLYSIMGPYYHLCYCNIYCSNDVHLARNKYVTNQISKLPQIKLNTIYYNIAFIHVHTRTYCNFT